MLTTKQSENSLDFDEKRKFQYGSNIYVRPETLTESSKGKDHWCHYHHHLYWKFRVITDFLCTSKLCLDSVPVEKTSVLKSEMKLMSSMLGYEEIDIDNEEISFSILNGELGSSEKRGSINGSTYPKPTEKCKTVNAAVDNKNVKNLMSQLKGLNVTPSKVFLLFLSIIKATYLGG